MKIKQYTKLFRLWKRRRRSHQDYITFQIGRAKLIQEELQPIINNHERYKLLDIGSHRGGYSIAFSKMGYEVTGLELDKDKIETAKKASKEYKEEIKFIQSDARKTPFKDNTFDVAILSNVIEHIPNTEKLLREIYRILKKQGILYIQFPPYWGFFGGHIYLKAISLPLHYFSRKTTDFFVKRFKLESELDEIEKITIDKLINLARATGFTIKKIKSVPDFMAKIHIIKELSPFCKVILEK